MLSRKNSTSVVAVETTTSRLTSLKDSTVTMVDRFTKPARALFYLVVNVPSRRMGKAPLYWILSGTASVILGGLFFQSLVNWLWSNSPKTQTLVLGILFLVAVSFMLCLLTTPPVHDALFGPDKIKPKCTSADGTIEIPISIPSSSSSTKQQQQQNQRNNNKSPLFG